MTPAMVKHRQQTRALLLKDSGNIGRFELPPTSPSHTGDQRVRKDSTMTPRYLHRILITFASTLLAYGFFMDTSVDAGGERIVNLSLQQQQLVLLLTGGILLIAGILLFGLRKLKQSPDDEKREKDRDEQVIAGYLAWVQAKHDDQRRAIEESQQMTPAVTRETEATGCTEQHSRKGATSKKVQRILIAMLSGITIAVSLAGPLALSLGSTVLIAATLSLIASFFIFQQGDFLRVSKRLLLASTCFATAAMIALFGRVWRLRDQLSALSSESLGYSDFVWTVIYAERFLGALFVTWIISVVALLAVIRAHRAERRYVEADHPVRERHGRDSN